jgi:hypothetical protein
MENNDNERSTLFTARSTENAMTFFTVVGFLTLAAIFVYHRYHENEKWDAALILVWERVPHVLSFSTLLTIFKEGVDVMLTRLQEYRDRRKQRVAKEVAKEVEKIVGKAKEEAYQKGYEAAKAESRSHGK